MQPTVPGCALTAKRKATQGKQTFTEFCRLQEIQMKGQRNRPNPTPWRRSRGATLTQVASSSVIVILIAFLFMTIRQYVHSDAGKRDGAYEATLLTATRHERDPELHRLGMMRQWGVHLPTKHRSTLERVASRAPQGLSRTRQRYRGYVAGVDHHLLVPKGSAFPTSAKDRKWRSTNLAKSAPRAPVSTLNNLSVATQRTPPNATPVLASVNAPVLSELTAAHLAAPGGRAGANDKARLQSGTAETVEPFHEVVVSSALCLTLRVGAEQGWTVDCSADKSHTQLSSFIHNGVLYLQGAGQLEIVATSPKLDNLQVSGDSTVRCAGAFLQNLKVVASGHSTVEIIGKASNFEMSLSGKSALRGTQLVARHLQAGVSGGSSMELCGNFGRLVLNAESGSSLRTFGTVGRMDLTATAGCSVDCSAMSAQDVLADASYGTVMKVCATKSLTVSAKQSSRIQYAGDPKSINATPDESSRIFL